MIHLQASSSAQEPSDTELLARVQEGDEDGLAQVYRRHAGPVLALAINLLSDRSLADDVVADVFVALWDDPTESARLGVPLRWFLLDEVWRRSLDVTASRRDRPAAPAPEAIETAAALRLLPDRERRVLAVTHFGGTSCEEAAGWLGMPEQTVKRCLRRSLHLIAESAQRSTPPPGLGGRKSPR